MRGLDFDPALLERCEGDLRRTTDAHHVVVLRALLRRAREVRQRVDRALLDLRDRAEDQPGAALRGDVQHRDEQAEEQGRGFGVVFIDPPYEVTNDDVSENLADLLPILTEDATIVVERSSRSPEPTWPAGYAMFERKDYGDTSVFWLSRG